jgi:hypothetical protein
VAAASDLFARTFPATSLERSGFWAEARARFGTLLAARSMSESTAP